MLVSPAKGEPKSCIDWMGSSDTISFSNVLRCKSMAFEFDVGKSLFLNRTRFTTLQRAYLNAEDLDNFLERCQELGNNQAHRGVVAGMSTRAHSMAKGRYQWGGCILGYSFRGGRKGPQPTLSIHSRVTYISYMGGMDLALCWVLARAIGERIGYAPEDFAFEWHVDALQYHNYKGVPMGMVYFRKEIEARKTYPSDEHPTLNKVRKEWDKAMEANAAGIPLEDERWGARRRIRRRLGEYEAGGGPPSCPVETLTFEALYR